MRMRFDAQSTGRRLATTSSTPKIPRLPITTFFGLASTAHYVFATGTGGYPFLQSFNRAPDVALIVGRAARRG